MWKKITKIEGKSQPKYQETIFWEKLSVASEGVGFRQLLL
jgi:hypothetical protein